MNKMTDCDIWSLPAWNIGLVGHVSNGKTTIIERLTNIDTKRDSQEKKRNCTIKLGYANALLWECSTCHKCYCTNQRKKSLKCTDDQTACTPQCFISFVDVPGHHSYVSTMIKGSSIMHGAILVSDARAPELQPQTMEHLAILEVLNVKDIMVVQNKIDLNTREQCLTNYDMLSQQLKGTVAENAPIVPASAYKGWNLDVVALELLKMCRRLKVEPTSAQCFAVVRTFDINRPSCTVDELKGGVLGGTVLGTRSFNVNDKIEIRPGLCRRDGTCIPIRTTIRSIYSESDSINSIKQGGLFALGTNLDPTLTKGDRLCGSLAGHPDDLPPIVTQVNMKISRTLSNTKPLGTKQRYLFVLHHLVVEGELVEHVKSNTYVVKFVHPICTQATRCIVYGMGRDTHMAGFGSIV